MFKFKELDVTVNQSSKIILELFVSNCIDDNGTPVGVPYLWGLNIETKKYYGFDLDSLCSCLDQFVESSSNSVTIYSYELKELYYFLKSRYSMNNSFRGADGTIHKLCLPGITICSLQSVSGSKTIEQFCGMKPFLDRLQKCPNTKLSTQDTNRLDKILDAEYKYLNELVIKYKSLSKIPRTLSKTIADDLTLSCYKNGRTKYLSKLGYYDTVDCVKTLPILNEKHFEFLENAFQGGFCGFNINHINENIDDVISFDFCSSYIACMLAYKYPMVYQGKEENVSYNRGMQLCEKYGCILLLRFKGLKSTHACKCIKNTVVSQDNHNQRKGIARVLNAEFEYNHLISADEVVIYCTNIDLLYYKKFYKWDSLEFLIVDKYELDYLPSEYTSVILNLFKSKSKNKCNPDKFKETVSKTKVNISYGLTVSGWWRTESKVVDNEFTYEKKNLVSLIDDYNNFKGRFFNRTSAYQWGIFCTAYARYNLFSIIEKLGDDWLYSDTDQVAFKYKQCSVDMINRYNEHIKKLIALNPIVKSCSDYIVKSDYCDKVYELGSMVLDESYETFKYLKAKSYLGKRKDGSYKLVLSGCSNFNSKFFDTVKPFEWFTLDSDCSVPLEYCDCYNMYEEVRNYSGVVTDFRGVKHNISLESGCYRRFTDFNITSNDIDNILLILSQK